MPGVGVPLTPGVGVAVVPGVGVAVTPGVGVAVAPDVGVALAPGVGAPTNGALDPPPPHLASMESPMTIMIRFIAQYTNRATLPASVSVTQMEPSGPTPIASIPLPPVGIGYSVSAPLTVMRPILLPLSSVNHGAPSFPTTIPTGLALRVAVW
jgi:hypothetical protein